MKKKLWIVPGLIVAVVLGGMLLWSGMNRNPYSTVSASLQDIESNEIVNVRKLPGSISKSGNFKGEAYPISGSRAIDIDGNGPKTYTLYEIVFFEEETRGQAFQKAQKEFHEGKVSSPFYNQEKLYVLDSGRIVQHYHDSMRFRNRPVNVIYQVYRIKLESGETFDYNVLFDIRW